LLRLPTCASLGRAVEGMWFRCILLAAANAHTTVASVFATFAIGSDVERLHNSQFALGMNARPPLHDGYRESCCHIGTKGCRPQFMKSSPNAVSGCKSKSGEDALVTCEGLSLLWLCMFDWSAAVNRRRCPHINVVGKQRPLASLHLANAVALPRTRVGVHGGVTTTVSRHTHLKHVERCLQVRL
jgi:hypothetical protein